MIFVGRLRDRAAARSVVAEASQLIRGRAMEAGAHRDVPPWAPLSSLALSDRRRLRRLAAESGAGHPAGWEAAVGRLAKRMLAVAPDEAAILRLQQERLIPLELDVLAGRVSPPENPSEFTSAVGREIDDFRIGLES